MVGGVLLRLIEPWPLQLVLDNVLGGLTPSPPIEHMVQWLAIQTDSSPVTCAANTMRH